VWNPTVANLTLMALGSSAPEIILSVLETVLNLGGCPGELGASTIVGSASFNLLVISAVSIYAVNEKNDNDPERDESVPKGVKKIYDMGVFSITAFFSIFAYVWMYICLSDQMITTVEAWLTFLFFFLLILMAWGADKWKSMQAEKERLLAGLGADDDKPVIEYQAIDIYRELIAEKNGQAAKNEEEKEKRNKMKNFLKETMKTD
jgi:Ca2+/Na+ antiporter